MSEMSWENRTDSWVLVLKAARVLFVAGPWEEVRLRCWARAVIWMPRLDAPSPVIDLDGSAAFVVHNGNCWDGSRSACVFDSLIDAKAEEDRLLRENGWILVDE